MSYDGSGDENSPAPGHTVSFSVKDFLHIKEVRQCRVGIESAEIVQSNLKSPTRTLGRKESTFTLYPNSDTRRERKYIYCIEYHENVTYNANEEQDDYCLNTIFQKLHFSKSHFSERPQEKYDHVTILHSISLTKCHKNSENRLTNKNFMPENNSG